MPIAENLHHIKSALPTHVTLIAVTKTHPVDKLMEVYNAGHKIFGENKVQEMCEKAELLPKDIEWHLIGHLQSNKVKYIAPFVHLIHGVDSLKLLQEINKQAAKNNRIISCLLQVYIAREETKFGLDEKELEELWRSTLINQLTNIQITGFMGMASFSDDKKLIRNEFKSLKDIFEKYSLPQTLNLKPQTLSMGMSSDYQIAVEEGSNMVRIGSLLFGERNYNK